MSLNGNVCPQKQIKKFCEHFLALSVTYIYIESMILYIKKTLRRLVDQISVIDFGRLSRFILEL